MADIGLISCCFRKLVHAAPAHQLYTSPLFRLAVQYVSTRCGLWFVLSALHGLVEPDQVLEPYDVTLHGLKKAQRQQWAEGVVGQLRHRGLLDGAHHFLLLAGADYSAPLAEMLGAQQPLRGLGIGRRLAWFRQQLSTFTPRQGGSHE